jgi:hypothetical protein
MATEVNALLEYYEMLLAEWRRRRANAKPRCRRPRQPATSPPSANSRRSRSGSMRETGAWERARRLQPGNASQRIQTSEGIDLTRLFSRLRTFNPLPTSAHNFSYFYPCQAGASIALL